MVTFKKRYILLLLVLSNYVLESIPKTLNGSSQSEALYLEGQAWFIRTMDVLTQTEMIVKI